MGVVCLSCVLAPTGGAIRGGAAARSRPEASLASVHERPFAMMDMKSPGFSPPSGRMPMPTNGDMESRKATDREAPRREATPSHDLATLRRAEQLVSGLTGVASARIVADPDGRIEEIHILTSQRVAPKQTVRNVESALQAQLGIQVDHRKVSVAQTQAPESGTAAKIIGIGQLTGVRRYLFDGYELERNRPQRIECRVRLRLDDQSFVGSAVATDVQRGRLNAAAQAALNALEIAEENEVAFALDGIKQLESFDVPVVVAAIYGLTGRTRTYLAGAAPQTDSLEHAAIMATLKATNRWILSTR